ncbi:helix-turn-helix domain-containing protein [Streptomyces sp. MBT56]|uniref:helix-turn-helix domain-containing protein n=1 Tax=unclassified Streptomyces TaxID=2593676 RepID=UPI00190CBEAA|nr:MULTISPECIES: helix-turn-helix domain-containing protein [unclassified Streptomyces]MBK3556758.1 helix-turn-helix domain-containing protein [Streptomyces sp. MBT56]MBK3600265.1 helix-turn-helix domain-containing protein [Streptomyces sp. MBT54]MBK3613743.1 helix-turn-helix domain-containing protein [Streptomyces sp. MBT98]
MGLAERRRALGYSQEKLAELLGVDRTTVGRWESGKVAPQPPQRRRLAVALEVSLEELDFLLKPLRTTGPSTPGRPTNYPPSAGDPDEMIRREFLRILTVSGVLTALPVEEAEALTEGVQRGLSADFARMNGHLWQVYQLARSKGSVYPVVRDQLTTLNEALASSSGTTPPLLSAAADLFQLAGELAFDSNQYADAAASYSLAASVSKDAGAYDLWACALVRHAYVDMSEQRHSQAAQMLDLAERLAGRGDTALSTRYWVASVQAEAYAGLDDLIACERALDRAEAVRGLSTNGVNSGWLRFDGTRLAEERGARYVQLGRLDLAENTLRNALGQEALAFGQSYRRRGAVLIDLAAIGARRRDPEQVVAYAREALELARSSESGYVARRLRTLCDEFGPLSRDHRVAELGAEIAMLGTP